MERYIFIKIYIYPSLQVSGKVTVVVIQSYLEFYTDAVCRDDPI